MPAILINYISTVLHGGVSFCRLRAYQARRYCLPLILWGDSVIYEGDLAISNPFARSLC